MRSLRWVFRYVQRYRLALAPTIASTMALVGIQLVAPGLIRTMVAAVTDPEARPGALRVVARLALIAFAV